MATYQLGAVSVPLSFLFGPEALEYRLNDSDARIAFVDPQSQPNLAPIRDRCPGITHVVGVAGSSETGSHPTRRCSSGHRHNSTPSRRARAIRRSSSTRAARPGRRRAP
jgi:long-subunit acyl-CoA synthetase (AMP-forming)